MLKHVILSFSISILACDTPDDEAMLEALDGPAGAVDRAIAWKAGDEAALGAGAPAQIVQYGLGLNYNKDVKNFNKADVDRIYNAGTKLPPWARFIFNITQAYEDWDKVADSLAGNTENWISKYCAAHDSGVNTALNIRWEFKELKKQTPFINGTCKANGTCDEYMKYSEFLTSKILPRIQACTNLLVIGNEPFLETFETIGPNSNFTRFYKSMAKDALAVWPWQTIPFYFGSFEALWLHNDDYALRDQAREELLTFVNSEPRISGVDLHMHARDLDSFDKAFDWLNENDRLINGKEVIITEFSPAPAFSDDMDKNLESGFKTKWGALDPVIKTKTLNRDYLIYAIENARSPEEFREWISTLPFSKAHPHYVCDAWKKFRSHGRFRLAFQGATQGTTPSNYDGTSWPWILNPILMPLTQQPTNGQPSVRWNWYNDVQKILKDDPNSPCP